MATFVHSTATGGRRGTEGNSIYLFIYLLIHSFIYPSILSSIYSSIHSFLFNFIYYIYLVYFFATSPVEPDHQMSHHTRKLLENGAEFMQAGSQRM